MKVIGISCFYHDSAACLTVDGEIIAAAQEERFTRVKHDSSFPNNALKYCLQEGGLQLDDIDYFVYYEKPFRKFVRIIETHLAYAPIGFKSFIHAMRSWVTEKLFLKHIIRKNLKLVDLNSPIRRDQILFSSHHLSHAASAFYPSPFSESAILAVKIKSQCFMKLSFRIPWDFCIRHSLHFLDSKLIVENIN
jgi:carbamoyltransferase